MPGENVPSAFEPLDFCPTKPSETRPPGYQCTNVVEQAGTDAGGSSAVVKRAHICFGLIGDLQHCIDPAQQTCDASLRVHW